MMFHSRENAAELLFEKLKIYKSPNLIIAGIPRGAMPMAKILAEHFNAPVTAVLAHKIPSPDNEEFAVGCVGLSGHISQSPNVEHYGIPENYIFVRAQKELKKLKEKERYYNLIAPNFSNKDVILVDDGIATGSTLLCAIHEVRSQDPKRIILAVAVCSKEAADMLRLLVDDLVALYIPSRMSSIGEFYDYFPQISDKEVIRILNREYGEDEISASS